MDYASRIAGLEALLSRDRPTAVARLRAACEAGAREQLGLGEGDLVPAVRAAVEAGIDGAVAAEATTRLAAAESWQWEIGTWASGSGEGLSSMFEVRTLQLAQAWLLAATGDHDRARALLDEVDNDPNRIAERLSAHVAACRERLAAAD